MTLGAAAFHGRVSAALDAAAAAIMFALMLLTCADVVGRYCFNAPVRGGLELTEVIMTLLVFASLPLLTAQRGHVTVDIVPMSRNPWLRRVHQWTVDALGILCLAVAGWQLWMRAGRAVTMGDVTSQLRLPLGLVIYAMAVLSAVAALALLARAVFGRTQDEDSRAGG